MAFDFQGAQKAGWDEHKIREYLGSKGRSGEADSYFGVGDKQIQQPWALLVIMLLLVNVVQI